LARATNTNEDAGMTPALLRQVLASLGGAWSNIEHLDTPAVEVLHADILGPTKAMGNENEMSSNSEEEDEERSVEKLNEWLDAATDAYCSLALRIGALIGTWLAANADDTARPTALALIETMQRVGGPAFLRLILNAQGVPPTHVAAASADVSALATASKQCNSLASVVDMKGHNVLHAIFEPLPNTRLQDCIARDLVLKAVEQGTPINAPAPNSGSTPLHLLAVLGSERAPPSGTESSGMTDELISNSASAGCTDADGFFPLHVAARAGPQAAPVVDALINQVQSSYVSLEDRGLGGAEVVRSLSPALTLQGESAFNLALAPGGLLDLVGTNNSPDSRSSQYLFLIATRFIESAAHTVTRGSQHPSSYPALGAAEGYTAAQRDALQRAQGRSFLSYNSLRYEWFTLDEVGITSGHLSAVVAAMALQSPPAHSLSLQENNLTGLFGTVRRLASTYMCSWPKTFEEALAYARDEANLFGSTSYLLSSSQFDVLSKLRHMDLSDNPSLNHLPVDFGEVLPILETLILSGCGFDHLPPCVGQMNLLTLIDLRGNHPLKSAHATWLNNAIALQQQQEAEVEAAAFILPTSLLAIAAAPLQDNAIKTPATRALALELARSVVHGLTGRFSIDLGNRGLDAGMLVELNDEISESIAKHERKLISVYSNRFKSYHHEHYLIPVSHQDDNSGDRDISETFVLCAPFVYLGTAMVISASMNASINYANLVAIFSRRFQV